MDAGQLLERRHHVHAVVRTVGDVLAPVVDVQGNVLSLEAGPVVGVGHGDVLGDLDGPGGQRRKRQTQGKDRRQQQRRKAFHLFHATSSPLSALWSRRYPRLSIALEIRMMDRMTTNMMVDRA